jgi:hypothetical protein
MSRGICCSNVRIESVKGPIRKALLPVESQPVVSRVTWLNTTRFLRTDSAP